MEKEILVKFVEIFLKEENREKFERYLINDINLKSHVLISANLPENRIDSAIRVRFSIFNSKDDVDKLVYYIKQAKEILN